MGIFERRDRRHAEREQRLASGEPAEEKLGRGSHFVARGTIAQYIYGRCDTVRSSELIMARCYSTACVGGEYGSFPTERIIRLLTKEEFAAARAAEWEIAPDGSERVAE